MSYEELKQQRARQQTRSAKQDGTTRRLPQQFASEELFQQVLRSSELRNTEGRGLQQHDVSDLRSSSQNQDYSLFSTENIEQTLPNPI